MTTPKAGLVERAVRVELRTNGCSVQSEGLGALAVALAKQIDSSHGAAAAALAAAQLRLILADVESLSAGRSPRKDALDELNARRAVKRAAEG